MLQNYNFSTNPQGDGCFFSFYRGTSSHVIPMWTGDFSVIFVKKSHKYEIMQNGVPYFFLKGRVWTGWDMGLNQLKSRVSWGLDMGVFLIDFILMIMNFGKLNTERKKNRIYLEGKEFRLIVTTEWYGKSKQLLLTAFDLRPISRKNPQRAKEMKKAPKR